MFDELIGTIAVAFTSPPREGDDSECGERCLLSPGPLPLPMGELVADAALRGTYIQDRVGLVLYGTNPSLVSGRFHAFADVESCDEEFESMPLPVQAIEVFRYASHKLVQAHFRIKGAVDPIAEVEKALKIPPGIETQSPLALALADFAGEAAQPVERGRRILSAVLGVPSEPLSDVVDDSIGASPYDHAAWRLASLTSPARFPTDRDDPFVGGERLIFSSDWRAMVLRDGVGFAMRTPLAAGAGFRPSAELFVRSIYSDALLIGAMQRQVLNDLSNRLADHIEAGDADALHELERKSTEFRNRLWSQDISSHGPANAILGATQRQLGTERLFNRVMTLIGDLREQTMSREAEAASQAQRRFERTIKFYGVLVAWISIVLAFLGANIQGVTAVEGVSPQYGLGVPLVTTAAVAVAAFFYLKNK